MVREVVFNRSRKRSESSAVPLYVIPIGVQFDVFVTKETRPMLLVLWYHMIVRLTCSEIEILGLHRLLNVHQVMLYWQPKIHAQHRPFTELFHQVVEW